MSSVETQSQSLTATLAASVTGLLDAVPALISEAPDDAMLDDIISHGFFRPAQNEQVGHWFARFLTLRAELWDTINRADNALDVPLRQLQTDHQYRLFMLGYAAACLLVRQDRELLERVAAHTLIQRKLNEAFPEYGIARKRYSAIFSGYTDPWDAWTLYDAMRIARRTRTRFEALGEDPAMAPIVARLDELEAALVRSKRQYFRGWVRFVSHRWRRRGVSASQQTVFAVLEGVGRTASHMDPGRNRKQVTAAILEQAAAQLQPGDVIVSRHRYALTNYLLPGTWPHTSLYIGTVAQREALGVELHPAVAARWSDNKCTLEALRDGVRFRPLASTLNVDCFVIIRPRLERDALRKALERVVVHEGKGYNFDFDFFTSDKLVCTEVIYRAFDGIGGIELALTERAGRHTLSAEQILDACVDDNLFEPVAIFGYPAGHDGLLVGDGVREALIASYRSSV